MTRSCRTCLAAAVAVLTLAAVAASSRAAGPSLEGNWKLKDVGGAGETTLALLKIEAKDGKPTVSVLAAPLIRGEVKFEDLKIGDGAVSGQMKFGGGASATVTFSIPKGEDKPKTLRGTLQFGKRPTFAELERTDIDTLKAADAQKQTPAGQALIPIYRKALAEREAPLKELLEKYPDTGAAYTAADMLLGIRAKDGANDADLKGPIDAMLKVAKPYGPAAEKYAVFSIAQTLTRAPKASSQAVEFARRAEKDISKDDTDRYRELVLKNLAWALKKKDKTDEAKEVEATLAKLTKQLDEEFERTSIPFKVSPVARKGKGSRVAVVELFTGAQCPPCVSADIAFDAAVKAYKPADVIFLEYHEHIPGPDPLTNDDTEGRMKFYGKEVRGTPTAFVNGKMTAPLGGGKDRGEESFGVLAAAINKALEDESDAAIKLTATRKGNRVEAEASVSGLKATGDNVRLRFVLVEEVVHYPGSNDQRFHHHVVRALPGGLEGFEMKEATGTQKVLVNLGELKKGLTEYLAGADKKRAFIDEDRPLDLSKLKLVALIQNDQGHEILQAVQIDVPEEK
jgi:hypothetical protein